MSKFIKGYERDAGVDIVLEDVLVIRPGFQRINLKAKYTPSEGHVAFLVSRGSTANKGIFPIMVAIDTDYEGTLTAWVFNSTNTTHAFKPGDRVFSVVNLLLAKDRVEFEISKEGRRGTNKLNSTGGNE
jgi:dUTPase